MVSHASDHELIRNCIARYCVGVDLGDWDLFSSAFHEDVSVKFPAPTGLIHGIGAVLPAVQAMVTKFNTQHTLGTQIIELTGEETAKATTYVTTVIFGQGEQNGKHATNRGVYRDQLVKISVEGRVDWRITERVAVGQWPLTGDTSIFATA
ncbi:hypothetical protein F5X68DRAFT_238134 [Plectosphaerella plurivora]|uniref:SnoaL-like domain-containing protein n=1 Tax=Plectosphaerella plurivora TaxID=936078 RepID=A0A9P8VMI5_9PEZI|nr:hypothetical protein F5X68DRAFT_238134 [Plectosphaerella plurivora]